MKLSGVGPAVLAILGATALAGAQASAPTLDDLLARAGAYVTDFDRGFSHVVAEEHYEQRTSTNVLRGAHGGEQPTARTLVSDFLLVKLADQNVWLPFRDVFEVDGKRVRDRQDRLTKLFLQPAATAVQQAEQIVGESSRYNIGVTRNINIPVLALTVLGPLYQPRFEFSHLKEDRKAGPGIWSVEYIERTRPTLIRGAGGIDLITQGRLWIEASTGRVVKTELVNSERNMRATITTTYRFDPAFNLDVPVEMHEEYLILSSGMSAPVTGTATYSNFRRFSVEVEEKIRKETPDVLEIPAGRFTMGSATSEGGRNSDETPHEVTISRSYLLGRFEVTQQEWRAVMGTSPSRFIDCGATCPVEPVENVSFFDVQQFLDTLNARAVGGLVYRLPTEAEWEYACRAGTTTPFSTGANLTTDQANYNGQQPYTSFAPGVFRQHPTPVGTFTANPWGLSDMHGNVWEWTADWYGPYPADPARDPRGPSTGDKRVIRGGSWFFDANSARCALRYTHNPVDRGFSLGFRVAADRPSPAR